MNPLQFNIDYDHPLLRTPHERIQSDLDHVSRVRKEPMRHIHYIQSAYSNRRPLGVNRPENIIIHLDTPMHVRQNEQLEVSLLSAEIPNGLIAMSDPDQLKFWLTLTGPRHGAAALAPDHIEHFEIIFPPGNYTGQTLAQAMQTQLNAYTNVVAVPISPLHIAGQSLVWGVVFNPLVFKFEFTATYDRGALALVDNDITEYNDIHFSFYDAYVNVIPEFVIDPGAPIPPGDALVIIPLRSSLHVGFASDVAKQFNRDALVYTIQSENMIQLFTDHAIFIRSNMLCNQVYSNATGTGGNILGRVPLNADFGSIVYYNNLHHTKGLLLKEQSISTIEFNLTDESNNTIDNNGLNWECTLAFTIKPIQLGNF